MTEIVHDLASNSKIYPYIKYILFIDKSYKRETLSGNMVLVKNLSSDIKTNVLARPTLETIYRSGAMERGRFMKLYSILYEHGPGNGTFLTLPFDQLVEHGPGHQFKWERSADPGAVIELANRGCFSALALSIGQAEKYQQDIGNVPLIVKIDGHLNLGKSMKEHHPRPVDMASIERAARVADAIGIAWYPGERQSGQDMERIARLIEETHNANLPVVLWGYTRGPEYDKLQSDSLLCCHYSVSLAESLGADVVKVKFPALVKKENLGAYETFLNELKGSMPEAPEAYLALELKEPRGTESATDFEELHKKRSALVASAAPRTLIGYSGGAKKEDPLAELLETSKYSLGGGIEGRIAGRNAWGCEMEMALEHNKRLVEFMKQPTYNRELTEKRFTGGY